jgi:hypothetical protein|eukprot:COSAG02_NODE_1214_length_13857_cov_17.738334_17_plen_89_part_00
MYRTGALALQAIHSDSSGRKLSTLSQFQFHREPAARTLLVLFGKGRHYDLGCRFRQARIHDHARAHRPPGPVVAQQRWYRICQRLGTA